jgi:hypothetical protein
MRRRFCLSSRNGRGRLALVLLAASILTTAGSAATAAEPVAAVFKMHEIRFVYRSFANVLACDELRNHITTILRAVGARDDLQVRVHDCDIVVMPDEASPPWDLPSRDYPGDIFREREFGRRQSSHVRVQVMFPVEATPQVVAEIEKDKSRRELISRVTGDPTAAQNDPIVFPAERKEITLSQKTIRRLRPEHCELLEQMIPTVFRELGVKVMRSQFACDRYGRSRASPRLTAEVLWPVGAPAPGDKDEKK